MLRHALKTCSQQLIKTVRNYSRNTKTVPQVEDKITPVVNNNNSYELVDTRLISTEDSLSFKDSENSVLEKCQEDISHIAPFLRPTFNFAAYMNKSETLQQLVKLGVELYKLEKIPEVPSFLLQLDFDKDIKNHVIFLSDLGLETDRLGVYITKNPFIFKESLENLKVRINYLKSKKFDDGSITRIVQENPQWLSISSQEIDQKLGFFQKNFSLTGNEVRYLTTKMPRLITYNIDHIKLNTFVVKEEMGFSPDETKHILLQTPKIFMKNQHFLLKTFEYVHTKMNIPLETIAQMPQVLLCREFRIKQRHLFLEKLNKLQFDPKQPSYISLLTLVSGSDSYFATEVAGSSVQTFNMFLKSL